jgi:formylglycine-generating enzyme required for sulfatase activity
MVANRDKLKVMGGSEALWGYLPVVMVSWDDANSFCTKLTMGERNRRFISSSHHYRLPTDLEWSAAVALPVKQDEAAGKTPMERSEGSQRVRGYYSWGTNWPPPIGAGNYDGAISYDPYEFMAPVGMFRPNDLGIFDLGGNVWEWCEDMYNNGGDRVVRGNSWNKSSNADYSASFRNYYKPGTKYEDIGFRCVIELGE